MRFVSVLFWRLDHKWKHYLPDSNCRSGREAVCVGFGVDLHRSIAERKPGLAEKPKETLQN